MIKTVPIYLIHIPFPYTYECDECGKRHWSWIKRGIIKIGEKKIKVKVSPMDQLLAHLVVKDLMHDFKLPTKKDLEAVNGVVRFKRYGTLSVPKKKAKKNVRNKKNSSR